MKDDLMNKLMEEVMKKMSEVEETGSVAAATGVCGLTEFVGTAVGNTIGFVIANVDRTLHEAMKIDPKYRYIGILSARTGAGPQIFAADEAVKAYLEGNLTYNPDVHCTHHDHEDGHSCGEHHCGEDKHGCAGNH